ncbi:FecCD family ABC transporter permease [Microbacterium esteraromaticum]|uniref:FecCD family ABC transporter permease n=1 Tax=Microbacterium esteraromaticum TaxID=57043 RepID=UPI003241CF08
MGGLVALVVLLVLAVGASLAVGANPVPPSAVWQGLLHPDRSEASLIVWTERMPRTAVGLLAGASFAVAGAVMQALTRNPLADPGLLGVNAGAGFAVTLGVGFFDLSGVSSYVWFAFLGAAIAAVLVYLIGSGGRRTASPVTLVLAGVALGAVLGGISTFVSLLDPDTFRAVRSWGLGSIARTGIDDTLTVAPFLIVGLAIAFLLSATLNTTALGDDLSASLGTSIVRTRVLGMVAVTLLAGGATALTGGIAFLGLMTPHIVRLIVGPDQRWILAYSAIAAAALVLVADVIGRLIARPSEIEVGILIALIGAPVLIALVRRRRVAEL